MDTYLLGKRMRDRRIELGYSLEEVATEVGVAASTVQRYEAGRITQPKMPVIEVIARVLDVSPAWLIGKSDNKGADTISNTTFRTRIRELRESSGYKSQQSFADAFGVAQSTVGNWEAGKREPNYETTLRLAQFFGVSVDYLLGRDTKEEPPALPNDTDKESEEVLLLFNRLSRSNKDHFKAILLSLTGEEVQQEQ